MKSKQIAIVLILIAAIGGIVVIVTKRNVSLSTAKHGAMYCSSDGTLVEAKPIQSHRSYCVSSDAQGKIYSINAPVDYTFSIVDDQGNTLKDFAVTHTKQMHVIVVRKDLVNFQHVHPEFNSSTGKFTLRALVFPTAGPYRIFADFVPAQGQIDSPAMPFGVTSSEDVMVEGQYNPEPLGVLEHTGMFDGYEVSLVSDPRLEVGKKAELAFVLKQDGKSVTDLEEYLGALGHSIVLREGTLDFIHAHPEGDSDSQNGRVNFSVYFPQAGQYKIFTQFQRQGKVSTTDFVVSVGQGMDSNAMEDMMKNMHDMH
ncbi:MAG: hypothetical protein Q7S48_00575 [bacterium]|nr:hypothetical protein [bacterium]